MYYKEAMFVYWKGTKSLRKLSHWKLFPCFIKTHNVFYKSYYLDTSSLFKNLLVSFR